jgi:hypothetical protein
MQPASTFTGGCGSKAEGTGADRVRRFRRRFGGTDAWALHEVRATLPALTGSKPELTVKAVGLGIVLAAMMGAANATWR